MRPGHAGGEAQAVVQSIFLLERGHPKALLAGAPKLLRTMGFSLLTVSTWFGTPLTNWVLVLVK